MDSMTQDMRFRLSVVLSYQRVGAAKNAIRYKVTRQFIYFWIRCYQNKAIHALTDHSHRSLHHLKQHYDQELKWMKGSQTQKSGYGTD